jgi:hypothetical protein
MGRILCARVERILQKDSVELSARRKFEKLLIVVPERAQAVGVIAEGHRRFGGPQSGACCGG